MQFLPEKESARPLEKSDQQFQRLFLDAEAHAAPTQFTALWINLEGGEAVDDAVLGGIGHLVLCPSPTQVPCNSLSHFQNAETPLSRRSSH